MLLALFRELPVGTYNNRELREKLGWPSNYTTSALSILRSQGHIVQVRIAKQVRWQLVHTTYSYIPPVVRDGHKPSADDIERLRTSKGGWSRAQLAEWGVSWPPPKGWKKRLLQEAQDAQ